MKEYTTIEAIQELCNNPNLQFQVTFSDGCIWKIFTDGEAIKWSSQYPNSTIPTTKYLSLDNFTMGSKWTLVQKPVPFTEAFAAWYDHSKSMYCISEKGAREFYSGKVQKFFINSDLIANGKWYIED